MLETLTNTDKWTAVKVVRAIITSLEAPQQHTAVFKTPITYAITWNSNISTNLPSAKLKRTA